MTEAAARTQRADLFFEDFHDGFQITGGPVTVTRADILAFAAEFDPQPFHLDDEAAGASLLGGLAASGWHTAALHMRLVYDGVLWRTASLGAPGIDAVRWLRPVRPGDRLALKGRVTGARRSRSKPDRGLVSFAFELLDQDGVCVMTQVNSIIIRCRPDEPGR